MERVISAQGLTKYYGKVRGVEDLHLEVSRGELFGFLGPNGAGKTTTMRLLMGLLRPTRGSATVLGRDCWSDNVAINMEVGYLPGGSPLYSNLTGEKHISFIAGFTGTGAKNGHALADRLQLDLSRRIDGYSSGMRQKLALVLALMKKPPVLIMDEPTSGLDPLMQHQLYKILEDYREEGITVMFSSHNLPEVERICSRVGIIRDGRLVGTERIEDLRSKRLRNVEVIFSDRVADGLEDLEGVSQFEVVDKRARFKIAGDMNPLVRMLAEYEIADFSVSHASLEDVFMEFYGKGSGGDRQ